VLLDLIAEFELSDLAEDLLRKLRFHPVLREPLRYDPNTTLEHHLYRVFVGVADARTQQVQLQQLLRERSAANLAAHSLIRVLPPGGAVQLLEAVWRSEEGGGQRLDKCIRTLLDNLLSHDLLFLSAHIEALMGSSNSKDHQLAFRMLAGIALHAYIKCYRKSVWKPKNKRHARTYTATASHLQVVLRLGSAEAQLNVADSCVRLVYLIVPEEPKLNLDDAVDALEKAEAMGGEATG
jgi:hypothetical protein